MGNMTTRRIRWRRIRSSSLISNMQQVSISLILLTFLLSWSMTYASEAIPRAPNFEVVNHINTDQRIRLRASIPFPDGGELGLPILAGEQRIALNGSAPSKVVSISASIPAGVYGAGQIFTISVHFTSAVRVIGSPKLVLSNGCHSSSCTIREVQSFRCQADEGAFAIQLPLPAEARTSVIGPDGSILSPLIESVATTSATPASIVVNVPAHANQDVIKDALESLHLIDEVTVHFGDDDDTEYSHGGACTSRGNNITITFERMSLYGTNGDVPMLQVDSLNAPLDTRTYQSRGDGSFLNGRYPASKVGITGPYELEKGWRLDDGLAPYVNGNGSTSLTFIYTVRPGENTTALDVIAFDFREGSIVKASTGELVDIASLPRPGQNASLMYSSATSLSFQDTIILDTSPAHVVDVTTINPDGVYTSGDVIHVVARFNVPVIVTFGSSRAPDPIPYIFLNNGGVGGKAYAVRSNGSEIYFDYLIRQGDRAEDLDYFDIKSFVLGNGTIRTASTSPTTMAEITLASPGMPGSISYNRNIIIDTTAPFIKNVSSTLPSGTYGAGHAVPIVMTFSEKVGVGGSPYILLATGSTLLATGVISAPTGSDSDYVKPARTGQPAEITLELGLNVALSAGESLSLLLHGFGAPALKGNNESRSLTLAGEDGPGFTANWTISNTGLAEAGLVQLTATTVLEPGRRVIVIDASNGIWVPYEGVQNDGQTRASLSMYGHQSVGGPITVLPAPGVGILSSDLSFLPANTAKAGECCIQAKISFYLSGALDVNDTISISFGPLDFTNLLPSNKSTSIALASYHSPFAASWDANDNTVTLKWTRNNASAVQLHHCPLGIATFPCYHYSAIIDGVSSGIKFPADGLQPNDARLRIWATADSLGSTSPVAITRSDAVGLFLSSTISFDPATPGSIVAIEIDFAVGPGDLQQGDVLTLQLLSSFTGGGTGPLVLSSVMNATLFDASYQSSTKAVHLTLVNDVVAGSLVSVRIDESNGFVLPAAGLSSYYMSHYINISCSSTSVPIHSQTIQDQMFIGAFTSLAVNYVSPALDNVAVDLVIDFTLSTPVAAQESIIFYLKDGFSWTGESTDGGHWVDISNTSTTVNITGVIRDQLLDYDGSGIYPALILTLLPQQYLSAGVPISVVVSATEGIALPPEGLVANDPRVMVSIVGQNSYMKPMVVPVSPCVGFCSSSLAYDTASAGAIVALTLQWTMSVRIYAGDSIRLSLPGFGGQSSSSSGLILTGGNVYSQQFTGSWTTSNNTLLLTSHYAAAGIPPMTLIQLVISGTGGVTGRITLPSYGMGANDPSLTISSNARDLFANLTTTTFTNGSAIQTSPAITQQVTVFHSSIEYLDSHGSLSNVAGSSLEAINISLAFDTALRQTDRLLINLPGFAPASLQAITNPWNLTCTSSGDADFSASWDTSSERLSFQVVVAGQLYTALSTSPYWYNVTIKSTVGGLMQLPSAGLVRNDSSLVLSGSLMYGYIPSTLLMISPLVVGIISSTLTYLQPSLKQAVGLDLSLKVNTVLSAGSIIRFVLPGFQGPFAVNSQVTVIGGGAAAVPNVYLSANWSAINQKVIVDIMVLNQVPSGVMNFTIPSSQGLWMPLAGHPADWSSLQLSVTDAAAGFQVNGSIVSSPCVGICTSSLDFADPKRGYTSSLLLYWESSFNLSSGDQIMLWLPGFTLSLLGSNANSIQLSRTSSVAFNASWHNASASLPAIVLTVLPNQTVGTNASVLISRRNLVLLPTVPLVANDTRLKMNASVDSFGDLSSISLTRSDAVGVMYSSNLTYDNSVAGEVSGLTVTFLASPDIVAGDRIEMDLPGFIAPVGLLPHINVTTSRHDSLMVQGTWDQDQTYLSILVLQGNITGEGSTEISISIPAANKLHLPTAGLAQNDPRLRLSVLAAAGPVVSVSFGTSPGIGSVLVSSVSFMPPWPNSTANISMLLSFGGIIKAGDVVHLHMPGFSLNKTGSGRQQVALQMNGSLSSMLAYWSGWNASLDLVAQTTMSAATAYRLYIPESQGMRLPLHGLYFDDPRIRIAVDGSGCPVLPSIPFQRVAPVGLITSSLRFAGLPTARESTGLRLDLVIDAPLGSRVQGGQIDFSLPGFTGPSFSGTAFSGMATVSTMLNSATNTSFLSSMALPQYPLYKVGYNASWNNNSHVLSLQFMSREISAQTLISIIIPGRTGIVLPKSGVAASDLVSGGEGKGNVPAIEVSGLGSTAWWNTSRHGLWPDVLSAPIRFIQPIGAFLSSKLSFPPWNQAVAGNATSILVNMTLSQTLGAGEVVTLALPNFTWNPQVLSLSTTMNTSVPAITSPAGLLTLTAESAPEINGLKIHLIALDVIASGPIAAEIDASQGINLPAQGTPVEGVDDEQRFPRLWTYAAQAPVYPPGQKVATLQPVVYISNPVISLTSTDPDSSVFVGGNRSVIRFPPSIFALLDQDGIQPGDQFAIGSQVMTIASILGSDITMKEVYHASDIHAGQPQVSISTPGYRPAWYYSGTGTNTLTFMYRVRPGDNTSHLEVKNRTLMYDHPLVDWIRRNSDTPTTDAVPTIPGSGTLRCLSYNKHLVIDTIPPHVLRVTSTKWNGSYSLGDVIDIQVTFNAPVSAPGDVATLGYLPLLRLGVTTSDGHERFASYASGSGTNTLVFLYTVLEGDVSYFNTTSISQYPSQLDYFDYDAEIGADDPSPIRTIYGGYHTYIRRSSTLPTTNADLTLALPGFAGSLSSASHIVVNSAAPRIIKMWSEISSQDTAMFSDDQQIAHIGAGDAVYIWVLFSLPVTVDTSGGRPYILLDTGTIKRPARYVSLSPNSSALIFEYLVQEGDTTSDNGLDVVCQCTDYTQTSYLTLNGSTIANASIVLPLPMTQGSLSVTSSPALVIDTSAPRVLNVYAIGRPQEGIYGPGEVIDIAIQFTSLVEVTGVPRLDLAVGDTSCHADYFSGSKTLILTFLYVVELDHGTPDLDYLSADALDLDGGSIRRYSFTSQTSANTTLPIPGQWGGLGFNHDIVIDPERPSIVQVAGVAGTYTKAPMTQALDIDCDYHGNGSLPFRLSYNGLLTRCFSDCTQMNASSLFTALIDMLEDGGTPFLTVSVKKVSNIKQGSSFLISLTEYPVITDAGKEALARDGPGQLSVIPCDTVNSITDNRWWVDWLDEPSLPRLITAPGSSKAIDLKVSFSIPVVVEGGAPYLDLEVGGQPRRAYYAPGARVQYIDVGVPASSSLQDGEFRLKYGDDVSACIAWNVTEASQSNALRNRLEELWSINAIGLESVAGMSYGNGYRFTITFAGPDPLPLKVVAEEDDGSCTAFVPSDAFASIPSTSDLTFRYQPQSGSKLVMTVKPNVTIDASTGIDFIIQGKELATWPQSGFPFGQEGGSVMYLGVISEEAPVQRAVISVKPLPSFLTSALVYDDDAIAGNASSVFIAFQLNANICAGDTFNITLPVFTWSGASTSVPFTATSYSSSFTAAWTSASQTLSLTASSSIQAFNVVEVNITSGFTLPSQGIFRDDSNFRIAYSTVTSSLEGPINYHPFKDVQPVGIAHAALHYSPREAGSPSNITVELEWSKDVLVGDQVHINLPGFIAPRHTDRSLAIADWIAAGIPSWMINTNGYNATPLLMVGSWADSLTADWFSHNETLTFTALSTISGGEPGYVTILQRNKIALPKSGLLPNDPTIRIWHDSTFMGNTSAAAVPISDGVGAFEWTSLTIDPLIVGAIATVNVTFTHTVSFNELESLTIELPGFTGCSNGSLALAGPDAWRFQGYWLPTQSSLMFVSKYYIANHTAIQLTVLPENHLHMADDGMVDIPHISTNASMGPVVSSSLNASSLLGHFLYSEVSFSTLTTETNVSVGFRMKFNGIIEPFTGFDLVFSDLRANVTTDYWNQTLLFITGKHANDFDGVIGGYGDGGTYIRTWSLTDFARGEMIELTFACLKGLRLPFRGLQEGDASITLWSNSTSAPMPVPEVVEVSPPFGLYSTSISYGNPMAGETTSVSVSFSSSEALSPDDEIRISLPYFIDWLFFNDDPQSLTPVLFQPVGMDGESFSGVWDPFMTVLTLTATADLAPIHRQITVPQSIGIRLPSNGTAQDSKGLTLDADTLSMGYLRTVPIYRSPAVGAVLASSLDLSSRIAGSITAITLSYFLSVSLLPSEVVSLALPGFSAGGIDLEDIELQDKSTGHQSTLLRADWVEVKQCLVLTALQSLAVQNLTLIVPFAAGLHLPTSGIDANHSFTVASDASEGTILPTPILGFPLIGAFRSSSIRFSLPNSGPVKVLAPVWMIFQFHLSMKLLAGEVVSFTLPGVTRPSSGDHNLTINSTNSISSNLFTAAWQSQNHTVRFQARQLVPSAWYTIKIDPSQGLQLPSSGYYQNDASIMVSTNASACPVLPNSVQSVEAVGFANSSLVLSPAIAGVRLQTLNLTFALSGSLQAGDELYLWLNGFSKASQGTNLTLQGLHGHLFQASWSHNTSIINMTLLPPDLIHPHTLINVGLSSPAGLITSTNGLFMPSQAQIGVKALSLSTNRNTTSIVNVQQSTRFGSLAPSSLEILSGFTASRVSELRVNFSLSCGLNSGDAVIVKLPGFGGSSNDNLVLQGSNGVANLQGEWDACAEVMSFRAKPTTTLPSGHTSIVVHPSNGLILPSLGQVANDSRLQISSNASLCPVMEGPLNSSQVVPGIVYSQLSYSPAYLQTNVSITVSFNVTADLESGDSVTLLLPGFTCSSASAAGSLVLNVSYASAFTASWASISHELTLQNTASIPAHTLISLTILRSNGLQLPSAGLLHCDPSLKMSLSTNSSGLSVNFTSIMDSPAVGILDSALEYSPALAGEASGLSFSINLSFPLSVGAILNISLPEFSGPDSNNLTLKGVLAKESFAAGFMGTWINTSSTLVLTATQQKAAESLIMVLVERSNGLKLPGAGIRSTTSFSVTVTDDAFGSMSHVIHRFPTIGAILTSSASFNHRIAGAPTAISINFTMNGNLTSGDQVIVDLGPLSRDWFQPLELLGPIHTLFDSSWTPSDFGAVTLPPMISSSSSSSNYVHLNGGTIRRSATTPTLDADLALPGILSLDTDDDDAVPADDEIWIDARQSPFVVEILSTSALVSPNVYHAGSFIYLIVRFTEPVVILGNRIPFLRLKVEDMDPSISAAAKYIDGNGTDTFEFLYQVSVNDVTADLSCFDSRSLVLPTQTSIQLAHLGEDLSKSVVHANLSLASIPCFKLGRSLGVPRPILVNGTYKAFVTEVRIDKANGTYGAGEDIDIFVIFSVPVVVQGSPSLKLATSGSKNESALYVGRVGESLKASTTLAFRYRVRQGDYAYPLVYTSIHAFNLSLGGSIRIASERPISDAVLTLPIPGSLMSLSGRSTIIIDTSPPAIWMLSTTASSGTFASGTSMPILIDFTSPVVVTGIPKLRLNVQPTERWAVYQSGSGTASLTFRYTVGFLDEISPLDYDGPNALDLNGGSILRASMNPETPANITIPSGLNCSLAARWNITVNYLSAARVLQVMSPLPNGLYTVGEEVPIHVTFSGPVTLSGNAYLQIDAGNPLSNSSIAAYQGMNNAETMIFQYLALLGDNTSALNIFTSNALQLVASGSSNGSLVDGYGNNVILQMYPGVNDARALNYSSRIALHSVPPQALYVTTSMANGTYGIGQDIKLSVVFNGPVCVQGQPYVQIRTFFNRPDARAMYVNGSGTSTLTFVYTTRDHDWVLGLPASRAQLVDYDGVAALAMSITGGGTDDDDEVLVSQQVRPAILANSTHPSLPAVLWLPKQDQSQFDGSTREKYRIIVNADPPRITGVKWLRNGTFGVGDIIPLAVTFTAPVVVHGTPTLLLNTSNTHQTRRYATFSSGNGTTSLIYQYIVQSGDAGSHLDYVNTRLPPYNVPLKVSTALLVTDRNLGAHQLPPGKAPLLPGAFMYRRLSTYPTTVADVSLPLPGSVGSLSQTGSPVIIDTARPTILQVTTNVPDGTYGIGFVIDIYVIFSAAVVVYGQPVLVLETGEVDRTAVFIAGNLTANLTFQYIISAGDNTENLDYVSTGALKLSEDYLWMTEGATAAGIKRISDNPATDADLILPVPARPLTVLSPRSIVGSGHHIRVAAFGYIVSKVTANLPNETYGAGQEIKIDVFFTDNATILSGTPRLLMSMSVGYEAFYVSGSGSRILEFIYKVRKGDDTPRIAYTDRLALDLKGGMIWGEKTGYAAVVTLPVPGGHGSLDVESAVSINSSVPTVLAVRVRDPLMGRYGVGDHIVIDIHFTYEVMLVAGTPKLLLRLDHGRIPAAPCTQGPNGVLSCTLLVEEGMTTKALDHYDQHSLVLGRGIILRSATDPVVAANTRLPCRESNHSIQGTSGSLQIDDRRPEVLYVTSPMRDGVYANGDIVDIVVAFSWNVTVVGTPVLLLNAGPESQATYISGSGTSLLSFRYRVGNEDAVAKLDHRAQDALILPTGSAIGRLMFKGEPQAALLGLPQCGSNASLGRSKYLVIDNSAPRIVSVSTDLENGTYGPSTSINLYVTFTENVTISSWNSVPQGWASYSSPAKIDLPVLHMMINGQRILPPAAYVGEEGTSNGPIQVVHFVQELSGNISFVGQLAIGGVTAFDCGISHKGCVFSLRYVMSDISIPPSLHLTYNGQAAGWSSSGSNGSIGASQGPFPSNHSTTISNITYDPNVPFVRDVSCLTPFSPEYGLGPGHQVKILVRFTSPVAEPLPGEACTPRLLLNLKITGNASHLAIAPLNTTLPKAFVFVYTIKSGECAIALDYFNTTALLGLVRQPGRDRSGAAIVLPEPGARGSISFAQKIPVMCPASYVTGLFPLKRPGTYVEGESIFIVVRFSQPVDVVNPQSHGGPFLQLVTGSMNQSFAQYYLYKNISQNLNFDVLPTDLIFQYIVPDDALTQRLIHGSSTALRVSNGTLIVRQSPSRSRVVDLTLINPSLNDASDLPSRGRWLLGYPKRIDIALRGLFHQDASDLQLVLTHGNKSVSLVDPRTIVGKTLGMRREDASFKTRYPWPSSSSNGTATAPLSVIEDEGADQTVNDMGYDYFLADLPGTNFAGLSIASQSSTMYGGEATLAIDGNTAGRFSQGSVTHTRLNARANETSWWQVRFPRDNQSFGTLRLWSRVPETPVDEVQVVTVAASTQPQGTFALSFRFNNGSSVVTDDMAVNAVASVVDEQADPQGITGLAKGESVQAKINELGVLGRVFVTRTLAIGPSARRGYSWYITFATYPGIPPLAQITRSNSTTSNVHMTTTRLVPGSPHDVFPTTSGSDQSDLKARLYPCWVMILPPSVKKGDEILGLEQALSLAVWSKYLPFDQQITVLTLPPGTVGKYVRIQLEGSGYLSFAELQAYESRGMLFQDYEGGARLTPHYIVQPFQPEQPLWEVLRTQPVKGAWNLQVLDKASSKIQNGDGGSPPTSSGKGAISDWILLVTDYTNTVYAYYMDVVASIHSLPKYGVLYTELPPQPPSEVWVGEYAGTKNLENEITAGYSFRVLGPCYGTDTTGLNGVRSGAYRRCSQNFGVGMARAPANTSSIAGFNFLENERVIWYSPNVNFLGTDSFNYKVFVGPHESIASGQVSVNVRNCRGKIEQQPHPLCVCQSTWQQPFGQPNACQTNVAQTCEDPLQASIFSRMCTQCFGLGNNGAGVENTAECRQEIQQAAALLSYRKMCSSGVKPDCHTEITSHYAPEAYMTFEGEPYVQEMSAPGVAGQEFMWSSSLAG